MFSTPSCASLASISRARSSVSHFGNGAAHAMALFSIEIPEDRRKHPVVIVGILNFFCPLQQEILGLAHRRDAGQIALDIGAEDGNAGG